MTHSYSLCFNNLSFFWYNYTLFSFTDKDLKYLYILTAVIIVTGILFVLFICVLMELCRLRRKISSQKARIIRDIPAVRNAVYEEVKKKGGEGSAYANLDTSPHYEVIMGK